MTFAAALFAPLALLLPEMGDAVHPAPTAAPIEAVALGQRFADAEELLAGARDYSAWYDHVEELRDQNQKQVRIERRMSIRIIPRPASRANVLSALPDNEIEPHLVEKKMAKCVPVAGIAGVQVNGPSNLILFMRDQRMVNAALDRSCRARDFYSGFYLQHSTDGKLCVDRDMLLSRSGANCKLTRFRQLVEADD